MTEKILLEVIILLLGCLLMLGAWIFRQHGSQHKELQQELTELSRQRLACGATFASKSSVDRAHLRIDEQQAEIGELSTRVARLEPKHCGGA